MPRRGMRIWRGWVWQRTEALRPLAYSRLTNAHRKGLLAHTRDHLSTRRACRIDARIVPVFSGSFETIRARGHALLTGSGAWELHVAEGYKFDGPFSASAA